MFVLRLAIVLLVLIGGLFWQPVALNGGLKTASNPATGGLGTTTPRYNRGAGALPAQGTPGRPGAPSGQAGHVPVRHPPMPARYRLHRNVATLRFNSGTPGGPPAAGQQVNV